MECNTEADRSIQFHYRGRNILADAARDIAWRQAQNDLWDAGEFDACWSRLNDSLEDCMERAECAEVITRITRDELEIFLPD